MAKKTKHVRTVLDLTNDEIAEVYDLATHTKALIRRGICTNAFAGRTLGMIFEKPSMRTRMSFQTAMTQCGGQAIDIRGPEIGLGKRESVQDVAAVMSRYVDAIMIRTFAHRNVNLLARHSRVPVINGLSDYAHPCQALADLFTVGEVLAACRGVHSTHPVDDAHLVFVGDGNNVARSLAMLCAKLGLRFTLSAPEGHEFDDRFLAQAGKLGGPKPASVGDPAAAVADADVIYTDVWASMGQEDEAAERRERFRPYQVNETLLAAAPKDAVVMHCLPAHRGDEITDGVMDGPACIAVDQAENRLHVQKGLLLYLLGGT
jgi:ornithine carbamoyltransferase